MIELTCVQVADRKNCRLSETNVNIQSGKSWAFEFGNDLQICPIVVEDLAYPGHLLIEVGPAILIFLTEMLYALQGFANYHLLQMLCNDRGVFLEIAQVIRSLDLTILKGVMESRLSNTWAHFIVEVIGF
jgi:hypothetical protein